MAGSEKIDMFCLLVTFLNGRESANDLIIKTFECGNAFDTVRS